MIVVCNLCIFVICYLVTIYRLSLGAVRTRTARISGLHRNYNPDDDLVAAVVSWARVNRQVSFRARG
uniref:Putative secreted protein n=1 Tax=Anopheles darlingi TaxID=43151 RepID=A0A2M4DJ79_ANODA